jgi:hypothetical protein
MPRSKPPANFYNTSKVLGEKTLVKPVTLRLPPLHPRQFELVNALDINPALRFICGACGTKRLSPAHQMGN